MHERYQRIASLLAKHDAPCNADTAGDADVIATALDLQGVRQRGNGIPAMGHHGAQVVEQRELVPTEVFSLMPSFVSGAGGPTWAGNLAPAAAAAKTFLVGHAMSPIGPSQ
jgi:hypothetical protein